MIKNVELFKKFQDELISRSSADIQENFLIFEILKKQAISIDRWKTDEIGAFDWKIKFARNLNGRK